MAFVRMPCFSPLRAFQTEGGDIVFAERGKILRDLTLPCGQCIGCRLERSRQWAVRCMHEASMHTDNCFITLTYDDKHVPHDYSLDYVDFQLFLKRLRKKHGKLRFFMCGEYGETYGRPHFHACIFGFRFSDMYPWRKSAAGFELSRSADLEFLWPLGTAEIGEVTFESAAYVARYLMSKVTGRDAAKHYEMTDGYTGEIYAREPEFIRMSLRPGIGATWYAKYSSEVFPLDRVVVAGHECTPPRYYKKLLDASPGFVSDQVEHSRYLMSLRLSADNTPARLRAKEIVCKARVSTLKRSVE